MRRVLAAAIVLGPLVACSGAAPDAMCGGRVSVPEYVLQFGQGLANFGDDETVTLEADSLSVLDVLLAARDVAGEAGQAATGLSGSVADFVGAMNSRDWSISAALDDEETVRRADVIGSADSLRLANTVEAAVIERCGAVPTAAPPEMTAETLPLPVVPAPTDTEPPAAPPDEVQEQMATGTMVGTMFGLVLSPAEVSCIGRELDGVVDATQAVSGPGQYGAQFQAAFDACGVEFTVPSD